MANHHIPSETLELRRLVWIFAEIHDLCNFNGQLHEKWESGEWKSVKDDGRESERGGERERHNNAEKEG